MNNKEEQILKRLKLNKKYNNLIPQYFNKKLLHVLKELKVPEHTIGVFFNPYTSFKEKYEIIKYFSHKHNKKPLDLLKLLR